MENKEGSKGSYFLPVLWVINTRKQIRNLRAIEYGGDQTALELVNNLYTQ